MKDVKDVRDGEKGDAQKQDDVFVDLEKKLKWREWSTPGEHPLILDFPI
jgi:hypothetical protein